MQYQVIISTFVVMTQLILSTLSAPIAPVSTIDNPCGLDPNAPVPSIPIGDLLNGAITQANSAAAACQSFIDKMKTDRVLTSDEFSYFTDSASSLPGLPIRQVERNVTRANAFTSKLRQIRLNVTVLHTAHETLANTSVLPTEFDDFVNNIAMAMFAVSCDLTTITQKEQQTFTQAESSVDNELDLLDYTDAFSSADIKLKESCFSDIDSIDMKTGFTCEGVIAEQMKHLMTTLVDTLRNELAFLGSL